MNGEVIVGIVKGYKANRDHTISIVIPKVARDKLGELAESRFVVRFDEDRKRLIYEPIRKEAPKP